MKKRWIYSLVLAGVLTAAAVQQFSQHAGNGIFYHVSGGKNDLYILGSIHVGSKEMYPMPSVIRSTIGSADVIVFECDTSSEEAKISTASLMRSEQRLSDRVSSECMEKVKTAAEKIGYSMDYLEQLDPWAVTSLMTVAAAANEMESGSSRAASALGVENMVRKELKSQKIEYLETAEEQLLRLEAFSPQLQEYLLITSCQAVIQPDEADAAEQDVECWPGWWKEGNAQAFADSYLKAFQNEVSPELTTEYHQSLLVARNQHMADKLCQMLEDGEDKTIVAVVGLMHLVLPDDSILSLLENAGYTVEQIVE